MTRDGTSTGETLSDLAMRRMAALLERLGEHPRIDETCQGVVDLLEDLFGFNYVQIFEISPSTGEIFPRWSGRSLHGQLRGWRGRVGEGIVGTVADSGVMEVVSDARRDPRFLPFLPGSRAEMAVPVRVAGRVRYVLNIETREPEALEGIDRGLVETLAGILGAGFRLVEAVERAESLSHTHREERNAARDQAALLQRENVALKQGRAEKIVFQSIVGVSPPMQALFKQMEAIRDTEATVLLEGETGTGKELVARALHQSGRRRGHPFITVNAANLQAQLFESELFGYLKGAFSGADTDREGLARAADGGTLFLDEVGELSLENQAKLLRFLDYKEVRPLGGTRSMTVDVRILTATNRDLTREVAAGRFRDDLLYRLRVIHLRVPSLRERREDLPALIMHFLNAFALRDGKRIPGIAERAMDLLLGHPWEGNVRELKNELERLVALTPDGEKVGVAALSPAITGRRPGGAPSLLEASRRSTERETVLQALEQTGWNVTRAARILGISRVGLTKKLKTLGLERPSTG